MIAAVASVVAMVCLVAVLVIQVRDRRAEFHGLLGTGARKR